MKITFKIFLSAVLLVLLLSLGLGSLKMFSGNWFANASLITAGFVGIAIVFSITLLVYAMVKVWSSWTILLLLSLTILQSCNYAKSNQQVVVSTDCGMTWKKINPGDAIPKGTMNYCYMKVVMPNYPMQGESKFVSNFSGKVRAQVHIDYDYSIIEPLAFINQAKYLGRANADADSDGALEPSAFEAAENTVIDKRLREVVKSVLLKEDIVDADQADIESRVQDETNKILEKLGVRLNFITLTFDLDEQTRQAIDVATAMKIYDAKGLGEVAKNVISARAGATKITVENKSTAAPAE